MHDDQKPRRGISPVFYVDEQWLALHAEDAIDPALPIVDPHHHLWDRGFGPYLEGNLISDLRCGHNIRATVYVEGAFAHRLEGDPRYSGVGEVEFANGVGALFASGYHGPLRACTGIVGKVDLTLGAYAENVLQACLQRAPDRFRGVRHIVASDASPQLKLLMHPPPPDLLLDRMFREGFACLAPLDLSFDAWLYHPQLPQLLDLVDAYPDTRVIINHIGGLIGIGTYAGRRRESFVVWKTALAGLAQRPNVFMKIGGMAMRLHGDDFIDRSRPPTSEELATAWAPYVETCLDLFGPERCMFESNFPPDKSGVSAVVLWNAFKRIVRSYSSDQRARLFSGTAVEAYRLDQSLLSLTR